MAKKVEPIIRPTEEQIEGWKKLYNKNGEDGVFEYTAGDCKCWFRKPDRTIISAAAFHSSEVLFQKEFIIRNCWLAGDPDLIEKDKYFFGLAAAIDQTMEVVQGQLKKA